MPGDEGGGGDACGGTVEGFNQTAFGARLADFVGVPPANVLVNTVPASILVTATIRMPGSGAAMPDGAHDAQLTLIMERLQSLNSTTASGVLQVPVLSIAPATITSTAAEINLATRERHSSKQIQSRLPLLLPEPPATLCWLPCLRVALSSFFSFS